MLLGETSLHVRGDMGKVLLAAAAYLVAVAMVSRGPLGVIRILGPRVHQVLDLVLVVGLAVSPIIIRSSIDVAGVIVAEALAIVLLRLAFRTHYLPAPVPSGTARAADRPKAATSEPRRSTPTGGVGDAAPIEAEPRRPARAGAPEPPATTAGDGAGAPGASEEGGAGAPAAAEEGGDGALPGAAKPLATRRPAPSTAWTLGVLAARAKRRGTGGSDRMLGEGARRLGTALGRANRRRSD